MKWAKARRATTSLVAFAVGVSGLVAISATISTAAPAGAPVLVQRPSAQTTSDLSPNTNFNLPWTILPTAGDTFLVAASNYCVAHPSSTPTITSDPGAWTLVNHAYGVAEGGYMWGKLELWQWTGSGAPGNLVLQDQG